MKRALTIAGSDSGGGAGIQADLKTFCSYGVYGTSVLTAVTAQNTLGVQGVVSLDPAFVALQLDSVLQDIGTDALKTGMLANAGIVETVTEKIKEYKIKNVVVDPVMVAKGGDRLLQTDAVDVMKKKLLPEALIITPNLEEAEMIAGIRIDTEKSLEDAARAIYDLGVPHVLIKGGHLSGDAVDTLYDGSEFRRFSSVRTETKNTHGTGCTFSAAITAGLALGNDLYSAVDDAKSYITSAIKHSLEIGAGHGPTNHLVRTRQQISRLEVLENIQQALHMMKEYPLGRLIPETQTNLALAAEYAETYQDVAAIPGRMIRWGDSFRTLAQPEFGASRSMAAMVLTARQFDSEIRAAMNIRFSAETYQACQEAGFRMAEFTWPLPGEGKESKKLTDILSEYVSKTGLAPDIVFNRGGWGKEAHIEFFGKDAVDIAHKIRLVFKHLKNQ